MGQDLIGLWPTESQFIRSIIKIERHGVKIDQDKCRAYHYEATERMQELERAVGFKPSETNALKEFFFDELKLPVLKRTQPSIRFPEGQPSLDKHTMEEYDAILAVSDNQTARRVAEYRGWQKADSACYRSYLSLVSPDGRLRPNFKLHGTRTRRLSCEKPNLQQIPRESIKPWNGKVKTVFIPEEGYELWEFDYKTLEFCIAAMYAQDQSLIDRLNAGENFHRVIAEAIGLDYHSAKTYNFASLYGAGKPKLAYMLGVTKTEIEDIYNNYHNQFPGFKPAMWAAQREAEENKYVKYWSGNRKHYNTIWNKGQEHKAFNAKCQGGGAEVVKHAMVRIDNAFSDASRFRMVLQVHDSVWCEIKKETRDTTIEQVSKLMTDFPQFSVKLRVDAHQLN